MDKSSFLLVNSNDIVIGLVLKKGPQEVSNSIYR